jgi:hypothetical protein
MTANRRTELESSPREDKGKSGPWLSVECCVSHSSPKTGLEWGTQRSFPVKKADPLVPQLKGRS